MAQNIQDPQEKLFHLLIHEKDLLSDFLNLPEVDKLFDKKFHILLKALAYSNSLNVLLTRESYKEFVKKESKGKQSGIAEDQLFVQLAELVIADKNDFPMLVKAVHDSYVKTKSRSFLDAFNKAKEQDYNKALKDLVENCDAILGENKPNKYQFLTLKDSFNSWYDHLLDKRNNPQKRLLTGISEIDESMQTGLTDGQLTLFVAEPGGFKSCMMINIALNVFMDHGESVLFVSLEMNKFKVMNRIISRETGIDLKKISQPELLTDDELEKVKASQEKWQSKMVDFGIIDNEERMTVGEIKRFIEKNQAFFKPKLVVIDYIAILEADEKYIKRNEYSWAGEMCKDLRQMGRKYGFSIISAVQLGKEALKRLKQQKAGKQSAGVEDMRGSHDYSADADNVYIQWPHPNEPAQKLCVVCAKARDGKKTFINDAPVAVLEIKPNIQRISSDKVWQTNPNDPIYKEFGNAPPKISDLDGLDDLDEPKQKKKSKLKYDNGDWL